MSTSTAEQKPTESAALAVRLPDRIATSTEFARIVTELQGRCHLLTPFSNIGGIAPMHAVWTSVVQINTDKAAGEVYYSEPNGPKLPWLKDGEVALAKNGLRKVASGLGIDVQLEHISVGQVRHYWHVRAFATYKDIDGSTRKREASMEWDLRDGSERLKGFGPAQISEARKHGLRNCETRAINAVIKECGCGVKQAYKREELAKPFVSFRVMFEPDYQDPETRRMLTERAMTGTSALYAPVAAPPALRGAFDDADEAPVSPAQPQSVGRGATAAASGQAPTTPRPTATTTTSAPPVDAPPVEGAVRIVKIDAKTGKRNDGSTWTKYLLVDHLGAEHGTFSKSIRDAAEKFVTTAAWVEIVEESSDDGKYRNVVEILPAGQQPSLPGVDNL